MIGNAVAVNFAEILAKQINLTLKQLDTIKKAKKNQKIIESIYNI